MYPPPYQSPTSASPLEASKAPLPHSSFYQPQLQPLPSFPTQPHNSLLPLPSSPNALGSTMLLHHLPRLPISSISLRRSFFSLPNNPANPFSTLASLAKSKSSIFSSPTSLSADCQLQLPTIPLKLDDPSAEIADLSSPSCGVSDVEEVRIEIPVEKLFIPPEVDVGSSSLSTRVLKGSNIVLSGYARDAQITQAEFVKSSKRKEDCPADGLPEFALVGRSNVGKSSLLNSLVRRKKLALTSKKPGKTQCINHFRVNDSWYLVDLPGYGYAAAPHEVRTDWSQFTRDYFLHRETLVSVFLLIDASIPAKQIDLEYASWLGQNQIPMTLVFTKCDKRKKKRNGGKRAEENVEDFQNLIREFFQAAPPWIMTSSVTNMGRDELLLHMAQLRNYWLKH